ncbi:MAG: stress response serine/threonine protein kinase YihE [Hydrogenophilales bacterium 16-64-46]|nr:MAG: stress response serine/threonine protein kinase YihE [Hydrogenophilales bacterium 12-64-13]OYZ06834.1 MAG: stress response serine/threonine protein kinase YihE [Hydrogenophilales bacterium 16-64-46]OZA39540.1 MAG: stress response serine/threonine protein kinase YihE [Hydrogenophilales bacterium 17-64-34]HQS99856.1 serine/threonine protein kinase [Thiobacillus sp.]
MTDTLHSYAALTPDVALDALDSTGLRADGRLLALNSFENRVYQMGVEDSTPAGSSPPDARASGGPGAAQVVVKFYRPARWTDDAILEEHAYTAELAAHEIPVVAPLALNGATLHTHAGFRFAVFPKQGGRAPEFDRPGTLEWMGRFLGRIHAVGAQAAFAHRPALDLDSFGTQSRDFLRAGGWLPPDLAPAWNSVIDHALEQVAHCYARAGDVRTLRLHGDCHPGNVLWTGDGPHFVDFDDARSGPAVQDLWMLLSGERDEQQAQLNEILTGYEDFAEFDPRELHLVEALRTLRLIHYAAWLARRWDDPAFPAAFPWFNTQQYWQARILELREQIALMDEPPLVA